MSSTEERAYWLHEHLSYELLMVRHTHAELQKRIRSRRDQLVWNANFAAFVLHARNVYEFLTNDKDSRNFKAEEYTQFEADKRPIVGTTGKLHGHAFHPGKNRAALNDEKVDLDKAKLVFGWIEANMATFLGRLEAPYKSAWNADMADPSKATSEPFVPLMDQATTTSHPHTMVVTIAGRKEF
jgi:hypothetical protein